MSLNPSDIYPVRIHSGNVQESFFENDFLSFQDIIENSSHEQHSNLRNYQSLPCVTSKTIFTDHGDSEHVRKLKKMFEESCLGLHADKYPKMRDKLFIHESICQGLVLNKMTTIQLTQSFYPWHYTGVFFVRSPEDLDPAEGGITFIDPLPVSDESDTFGIMAKKGNIVIFPSWLKFRFSPIKFQSHENGAVMMFIMNCFITHQKFKDYKDLITNQADEFSDADLNVLTSNTGEKTETEIGWTNSSW